MGMQMDTPPTLSVDLARVSKCSVIGPLLRAMAVTSKMPAQKASEYIVTDMGGTVKTGQ